MLLFKSQDTLSRSASTAGNKYRMEQKQTVLKLLLLLYLKNPYY